MKQGNIIITGMPGSGKSTIGRMVAHKTNLDFFDLDNIIEKNEGEKISEIFKKNGEKYFRELENSAIRNLNSKNFFVLSTGGGTVENSDNAEFLKKTGLIFYLKIEPDLIFERIKNDFSRPLLLKSDPREELKKIYARRKKNYELANYTIDASKDVDEITDEIVKIYEKING